MKNKFKNSSAGCLKLIILIVIALLLLKYFGITLSSAFDWIKTLLSSVFK